MRTCSGLCLLLPLVTLAACVDDPVAIDASTGTVDCGTTDAGRDAAFEGTLQCDLDAGASVATPDGWFAAMMTLDVWWPGQPLTDPGRGEIEIDTLSRVDDAGTTIKVCGITLPTYTSDGFCDAYQLTIPDEAWDSPTMPRFTARSIDDADAGNITLAAATALIGIDFLNGEEDGDWPTSNRTGQVACEAGIGRPCFPDHDNDSFDGVTAHFRIDGAMYTGPYGSGSCTNGQPYTYGGSITVINLGGGGGGFGAGPRADRVRLGLRTRVLGPGASDSDCTANVDLRAYDCTIDPTTLPTGYTRPATGTTPENACVDHEAQLVDDLMPAYRVLARGQAPGESMPPLGWVMASRDIDKRPSTGSRSAFVRLADLAGAEPTCAQVRAAAFPM